MLTAQHSITCCKTSPPRWPALSHFPSQHRVLMLAGAKDPGPLAPDTAAPKSAQTHAGPPSRRVPVAADPLSAPQPAPPLPWLMAALNERS